MNAPRLANAAGQPPDLTDRQIVPIIASLMMGLFLGAIDQTIVATALPTIVGELGSMGRFSWVVTAYMLASTISMPVYGKLGDLFGRKYVYQGAIVIFLAGSALSGLARSINQLVLCRGLQGLGGGGLIITAVTMIADVVPPRERGRYQGYFGGVFAAASVLGPLLGGVLTERLSWRWVFYVNLPFGLATLAVVAAAVPRPIPRRRPRIDYPGLALIAAAVTCLVLVTSWGGTVYPWTSPRIMALAIAAIALAGLFAWVERRAAEPVLPPSLFRNSTFDIASATMFLVGFGMFGVTSFLPLFLQVAGNAGPTKSGFLLLPFTVGMVAASITCGRLITKTGRYKIFPVVGTLLATVGMFLVSRLGADTPRALTTAYLLVCGAGIGSTMQVMVVATQNSVEMSTVGVATSMIGFCRSIGGSFGVALFGSIFNARLAIEVAPALLQRMGGVATRAQLGRALELLPPASRAEYGAAVARALDTTFLFAVPALAAAFVLVVRLREAPLRARQQTPQAKAA